MTVLQTLSVIFALERVLYENFKELGVPTYTEEENKYADTLADTYDHSAVPGVAAEYDPEAKEKVDKDAEGIWTCHEWFPDTSVSGRMPSKRVLPT